VTGPVNTQFAVAVHVLTLLAGGGDGLRSSTELAGSVGTNPAHVRRVIGLLRRAGLVSSTPGARGGSVLVADPSTVTLRDIWIAVMGDARVLGVHAAAIGCPEGQAIQATLQQVERDAAAALSAELDRTTLADVLATTPAGATSALPHPSNQKDDTAMTMLATAQDPR
jgi:Rrf2 family protein